MLTTSALSQNRRGARRLSLKRDRQRYRQGDERRKAGELDRWVVMMSRGEREWHTAPISAFFFFLHHSFALFYLSTCQIYFFSTFILSLSHLYTVSSPHCLSFSAFHHTVWLVCFSLFKLESSGASFLFCGCGKIFECVSLVITSKVMIRFL